MTEAPNSPKRPKRITCNWSCATTPAATRRGYTDGYYVSFDLTPLAERLEGKKGVVLHIETNKNGPQEIKLDLLCRRSSHSLTAGAPVRHSADRIFTSCRGAPQRRVWSEDSFSGTSTPFSGSGSRGSARNCVAGRPPRRSEPALPGPCPGSRSNTGRAPRTGLRPASRRIVFSPRGRRFAENRYLCIMSIVRNTESDLEFENKIRPQELETFSGQDKIVENLHIFIKAALMRGDSLDHVLFARPPGLGKTTLANIIANEMGAHCASRRVRCSTSRATWRAC